MKPIFKPENFLQKNALPYLVYTAQKNCRAVNYAKNQIFDYMQKLNQKHPLYVYITADDTINKSKIHEKLLEWPQLAKTVRLDEYSIGYYLPYVYHILPDNRLPSTNEYWTQPYLDIPDAQFLTTTPLLAFKIFLKCYPSLVPDYLSNVLLQRVLKNISDFQKSETQLQINKLNPNIPNHLKYDTYFPTHTR